MLDENIRAMRREKELTQEQLAEQLIISLAVMPITPSSSKLLTPVKNWKHFFPTWKRMLPTVLLS